MDDCQPKWHWLVDYEISEVGYRQHLKGVRANKECQHASVKNTDMSSRVGLTFACLSPLSPASLLSLPPRSSLSLALCFIITNDYKCICV